MMEWHLGRTFRLATFMLALTVLCGMLAIAVPLYQVSEHYDRQERAVQALRLVNGYDVQPATCICARFLDTEDVVGITLIRGNYTDNDLAVLRDLPELRRLVLAEAWPFVHSDNRLTDAVIGNITGLKKLELLDVRGTEITEGGVEILRRALPQCDIVWDSGSTPQNPGG